MNASVLPVPPAIRPSFVPNGRTAPPSRRALTPVLPVFGERGRWALAQLATALLLVAIVIGGVFSLGPGRFDRWDDAPEHLPAIVGSPATPESVATETLLDVAVGTLPAGRGVVGVYRWTLQPSLTALTMPALPGVIVIAVETGAAVVAVGGIDHNLAPGDYLALADEPGLTLRASGSTPAVALIVYALAGVNSNSARLAGWEYDLLAYNAEYPIYRVADALPGGPARLRLERLTLPPGAALPLEDASPLVWVGLGTGTLGVTLAGERLPFRWKPGEEQKIVLGQNLPPLAPGTAMTLRNAGDGPLVLYRLTITPIPEGIPAP